MFLAVLHYNENADRECKRGRDGEPRLKVANRKYMGGKGTARPVKEKATFGKFSLPSRSSPPLKKNDMQVVGGKTNLCCAAGYAREIQQRVVDYTMRPRSVVLEELPVAPPTMTDSVPRQNTREEAVDMRVVRQRFTSPASAVDPGHATTSRVEVMPRRSSRLQ